jgi:hypothetical protein
MALSVRMSSCFMQLEMDEAWQQGCWPFVSVAGLVVVVHVELTCPGTLFTHPDNLTESS